MNPVMLNDVHLCENDLPLVSSVKVMKFETAESSQVVDFWIEKSSTLPKISYPIGQSALNF